jgi:hypothetical protein
MLGKMLVHGLAAAILIGSAAAYAQTRGNGYVSPTTPSAVDQAMAGDRGDAVKRTGGRIRSGDEMREHSGKSERHRKHRDHDHDGERAPMSDARRPTTSQENAR